jgi:Tfp pilus assembly protein PilW
MRSKRAVTLIELSIALILSVGILGVLVIAYVTGTRLFNAEMGRSSSYMEANKALNSLRTDLRSCLALTSASATGISFWAEDFNANSSMEANEIFSYSWNGTPGSPLIRTISGSSTMMAKDIQSLALTYDNASLASITEVSIKVAAGTAGNIATLESSVKLRNI